MSKIVKATLLAVLMNLPIASYAQKTTNSTSKGVRKVVYVADPKSKGHGYRRFVHYESKGWQEEFCPSPIEYKRNVWRSSISEWPKKASEWEIRKLIGAEKYALLSKKYVQSSMWNFTGNKVYNYDTYAGLSYPRDFQEKSWFGKNRGTQ